MVVFTIVASNEITPAQPGFFWQSNLCIGGVSNPVQTMVNVELRLIVSKELKGLCEFACFQRMGRVVRWLPIIWSCLLCPLT